MKKFKLHRQDAEVLIPYFKELTAEHTVTNLLPLTSPKGSDERKSEVQKTCKKIISVPFVGYYCHYRDKESDNDMTVIYTEKRFIPKVREICRDLLDSHRAPAVRSKKKFSKVSNLTRI